MEWNGPYLKRKTKKKKSEVDINTRTQRFHAVNNNFKDLPTDVTT